MIVGNGSAGNRDTTGYGSIGAGTIRSVKGWYMMPKVTTTVATPTNLSDDKAFLESLGTILESGTYQVPLTRNALVILASDVAGRMTEAPKMPDWPSVNLKDEAAVKAAADQSAAYPAAMAQWAIVNAPRIGFADAVREAISRKAEAKAKAAEQREIILAARAAK